jgi:hypothetical protein
MRRPRRIAFGVVRGPLRSKSRRECGVVLNDWVSSDAFAQDGVTDTIASVSERKRRCGPARALHLAYDDGGGVPACLLRGRWQVAQRSVGDVVGVDVERRGILGIKALNQRL